MFRIDGHVLAGHAMGHKQSTREVMAKTAFIGLGVMGYPMAGHLKAAGHDVVVYNRNQAKADAWAKQHGGRVAATPRWRRACVPGRQGTSGGASAYAGAGGVGAPAAGAGPDRGRGAGGAKRRGGVVAPSLGGRELDRRDAELRRVGPARRDRVFALEAFRVIARRLYSHIHDVCMYVCMYELYDI